MKNKRNARRFLASVAAIAALGGIAVVTADEPVVDPSEVDEDAGRRRTPTRSSGIRW